MTCFLALALAFFLPLMAGHLLLSGPVASRLPRALLDIPCGRSLHDRPVLRLGGLCIWLGVLTSWFFISIQGSIQGPMQGDFFLLMVYSCVVALIFISFLDDFFRISPMARLLAHLSVSFFWAYVFFAPEFLGAIVVVLALSLTWMTNLFNFMDGSDGLAGCMACAGFGFYGLAAFLAGDMQFACLNWAVSLASLAFLFHNAPPARMFMGDAGSIPLGFLAGAFGITGWKTGLWPWFFPVLVFSFFIVDATVTLFKRLLKAEKIWHAHCSHYYQRLARLKAGVRGHRHVLKTGCITMLLSGISGMLGIYYSNLHIWLLGWAVWYLYFFMKIDKKYNAAGLE
jgi:UDP-N-acetylmuramyl pentapeptide phosphotransferase/UDP-N-acetylglucosamine-1-phosphate transferase